MSITCAFPAGRGVDWWARRNAVSPVPGRWPYGLDALAGATDETDDASGGRVEAVEVAPLGRFARQFGLRTGRAPKPAGSRLGPAADRVTLCWDESLAPAMLHGVAARRRFAGVIWATDRVAAQGESPQTRLIRQSLLQFDGLWVLSRPQIPAVQAWLGPNCPPVHFLTFGVDPDFYRAAPYPNTGEASPGGHGPTIVSVGGDRDRDPDTLFAALELVLERRPDARCVVQSRSGPGSGSERSTLAGVRRESFIPHDQVRGLYADASVVALATSDNLHGSGMTVSLEAMSVGRPVVATGTPGMKDYVVDGVTGALVAPRDPAELAARILNLLDDPVAAATMGESGRDRVLERHTTSTMCAELLQILS